MKKILANIEISYTIPALSSNEIKSIEESLDRFIEENIITLRYNLQRRGWSTIEVIRV